MIKQNYDSIIASRKFFLVLANFVKRPPMEIYKITLA